MANPLPSPVKRSVETVEKELSLANAVLAIDAAPPNARLCNRDILFAVEQQFSLPRSSFSVSTFHSDFIIHLSTPSDRDRLLAADPSILYVNNCNMMLIPWTPAYKSKTISWETEVAIDIANIPPHACFVHCLEPTLLPHCTIELATFNKLTGTCRVIGFASSVGSIPSQGHIGVQYPRPGGVANDFFPVSLRAYPVAEAPRFRSDSPPQSPDSPSSLNTDEEFDVDPDALREAEEEWARGNPNDQL